MVDDERVHDFFEALGDYNSAGLSAIDDYDSFRWHCETRERWGRPRFGFKYLTCDNAAEGLEEAADGGIYSCLAYWKMYREEFDPDVGADLLAAAHAFAEAHAWLRRAQARRKGAP